MTLKGTIPILYGASPIPRDLTLYEQKHGKKGQCKKHCPMLQLPVLALRLLLSRALSSKLVIKNNMELKGNKTKRLICPNMKTIIMVKADNSCATKTGHFYLSLTSFRVPGENI
jgi:hypothetical protein